MAKRAKDSVLASSLRVASPDLEMVKNLTMILVLPVTIEELVLAIWLWIKSGKETRIKK